MSKKYRKTILIDLDGVLNEYTGDFDKDYIPPIKDGAKEFLGVHFRKPNLLLLTKNLKILPRLN